MACLLAATAESAVADTNAGSGVAIGGPFTLTSADGVTVTEASYRGRWLLLFFGYTFCPDVCPATLARVADALEALGPDAERVKPIFITVDPGRDTPDVLRRFTEAFDSRIDGLTGAPEQIASVARAYGAYYKAHRTDAADPYYAVDHSTYLYIIDPDGAFVRAVDHREPGERIADVLRDHVSQR